MLTSRTRSFLSRSLVMVASALSSLGMLYLLMSFFICCSSRYSSRWNFSEYLSQFKGFFSTCLIKWKERHFMQCMYCWTEAGLFYVMKLWFWPVTTLSPLSKKYVGCADKHMDCVQRKCFLFFVFLFFFSKALHLSTAKLRLLGRKLAVQSVGVWHTALWFTSWVLSSKRCHFPSL